MIVTTTITTEIRKHDAKESLVSSATHVATVRTGSPSVRPVEIATAQREASEQVFNMLAGKDL